MRFAITRVPGIANLAFGADGFHLVALTGLGQLWLPSMLPSAASCADSDRTVTIICRTARRITPKETSCVHAGPERSSVSPQRQVSYSPSSMAGKIGNYYLVTRCVVYST